MSTTIQRTLVSAEQTQAVGRLVGMFLRGGDFLALTGPLGAGKTQFIKGLAGGLGVPEEEPVVSPTFVLVREYRGRLKLYHIDAYRLNRAEELFALGLAEMLADQAAVIALEWADRAAAAVPPHACRVTLRHVAADCRHLALQWTDVERLAELASALAGVLDSPPDETFASTAT